VKKRLNEPASVVCNPSLAKVLIGWEAKRNPFSGSLELKYEIQRE
jgi:hypothetical protein